MNRSIKSLLLLAVLSLGMNGLCASSAELSSADAQDCMEVNKHKLSQKMVSTINDYFAVDATHRVRHEDDHRFFKAFQELHDEYTLCCVKGDAQVDQELRATFDMRMKEKLLKIKYLNDELSKKRERGKKGIMHNIQPVGMISMGLGLTFVGGALIAVDMTPKLLPDNLEMVGYIASAYAGILGLKGVIEGLAIGLCCLEEEMKYLDCQIRFCTLSISQLDRAYAYAFPGGQKLSDQVNASLELGE